MRQHFTADRETRNAPDQQGEAINDQNSVMRRSAWVARRITVRICSRAWASAGRPAWALRRFLRDSNSERTALRLADLLPDFREHPATRPDSCTGRMRLAPQLARARRFMRPASSNNRRSPSQNQRGRIGWRPLSSVPYDTRPLDVGAV